MHAQGVEFTQEPVDRYGSVAAGLRDPSGNGSKMIGGLAEPALPGAEPSPAVTGATCVWPGCNSLVVQVCLALVLPTPSTASKLG